MLRWLVKAVEPLSAFMISWDCTRIVLPLDCISCCELLLPEQLIPPGIIPEPLV